MDERVKDIRPNMDALQENYSERIKGAQEQLGLSQAALARKWGFPKQTVSAWVNNVSAPQGLYREKLERLLKRLEE